MLDVPVYDIGHPSHSDRCPYCRDEKETQFSEGTLNGSGPWCLIENAQVWLWNTDDKHKCKHCHSLHGHTYGGGPVHYHVICPRAVSGYLEEYGSRTTLTCLDCLLEGLGINA